MAAATPWASCWSLGGWNRVVWEWAEDDMAWYTLAEVSHSLFVFERLMDAPLKAVLKAAHPDWLARCHKAMGPERAQSMAAHTPWDAWTYTCIFKDHFELFMKAWGLQGNTGECRAIMKAVETLLASKHMLAPAQPRLADAETTDELIRSLVLVFRHLVSGDVAKKVLALMQNPDDLFVASPGEFGRLLSTMVLSTFEEAVQEAARAAISTTDWRRLVVTHFGEAGYGKDCDNPRVALVTLASKPLTSAQLASFLGDDEVYAALEPALGFDLHGKTDSLARLARRWAQHSPINIQDDLWPAADDTQCLLRCLRAPVPERLCRVQQALHTLAFNLFPRPLDPEGQPLAAGSSDYGPDEIQFALAELPSPPPPGPAPTIEGCPWLKVRRLPTGLVGRSAVLNRVCGALLASASACIVVHGEHGVGKTALAAECVHRLQEEGALAGVQCGMIRGNSQSGALEDLVAFGRRVMPHMPPPGHFNVRPDAGIEMTRAWLCDARNSWLLVVDDALNVEVLDAILPPVARFDGRLVLTTLAAPKHWKALAPTHSEKLGPLEPDAAREVVYGRRSAADAADADALFACISRRPSALSLARRLLRTARPNGPPFNARMMPTFLGTIDLTVPKCCAYAQPLMRLVALAMARMPGGPVRQSAATNLFRALTCVGCEHVQLRFFKGFYKSSKPQATLVQAVLDLRAAGLCIVAGPALPSPRTLGKFDDALPCNATTICCPSAELHEASYLLLWAQPNTLPFGSSTRDDPLAAAGAAALPATPPSTDKGIVEQGLRGLASSPGMQLILDCVQANVLGRNSWLRACNMPQLCRAEGHVGVLGHLARLHDRVGLPPAQASDVLTTLGAMLGLVLGSMLQPQPVQLVHRGLEALQVHITRSASGLRSGVTAAAAAAAAKPGDRTGRALAGRLTWALGACAWMREYAEDLEGGLDLLHTALRIQEEAAPEEVAAIANTLQTIGRLHRRDGGTRKARIALERALGVHDARPRPSLADLANTLAELATVHQSLGLVDMALTTARRCLAVAVELCGAQSLAVKGVWSMCVLYHAQSGDAAGVAECQLQAEAPAANGPHAEGVQMVPVLLRTGETLLRTEQPILAARALGRALRICEALWGEGAAATADVLGALASVCVANGALDRALRLSQKALATMITAWGNAHPQVAHALIELGSIRQVRGEDQMAVALFERAQGIQGATLSADHPDRSETLVHLAHAQEALGDPGGQAIALLKKAARAFRKRCGAGEANVIGTLTALGTLHVARGEYDEAADVFGRAIRGFDEAHRNTSSPFVLTLVVPALCGLADANKMRGDLVAARDLQLRALAVYQKRQARGAAGELFRRLGLLSDAQGRLAEAISLHESSLRAYEEVRGPDSLLTASQQMYLASALARNHEHARSAEVYSLAAATYCMLFGPDNSVTTAVIADLAAQCTAAGDVALHNKLYAKALRDAGFAPPGQDPAAAPPPRASPLGNTPPSLSTLPAAMSPSVSSYPGAIAFRGRPYLNSARAVAVADANATSALRAAMGATYPLLLQPPKPSDATGQPAIQAPGQQPAGAHDPSSASRRRPRVATSRTGAKKRTGRAGASTDAPPPAATAPAVTASAARVPFAGEGPGGVQVEFAGPDAYDEEVKAARAHALELHVTAIRACTARFGKHGAKLPAALEFIAAACVAKHRLKRAGERLGRHMAPGEEVVLGKKALMPPEASGELESAADLYAIAIGVEDGNKLEAASLLCCLANVFAAVGNHKHAMACYQEAWSRREEQLGSSDLDTLDAMHNLGRAHLAAGEYNSAAQLVEGALGISVARTGAEHPASMIVQASLASVRTAQGQFPLALELYKESLGIQVDGLLQVEAALRQSGKNVVPGEFLDHLELELLSGRHDAAVIETGRASNSTTALLEHFEAELIPGALLPDRHDAFMEAGAARSATVLPPGVTWVLPGVSSPFPAAPVPTGSEVGGAKPAKGKKKKKKKK